jgi:hypothetical protein
VMINESIHLYAYVLVFAVCCSEARDKPTLSLKNTGSGLGERLPLNGISFANKDPFSLTSKGTRRIFTDKSGYKKNLRKRSRIERSCSPY